MKRLLLLFILIAFYACTPTQENEVLKEEISEEDHALELTDIQMKNIEISFEEAKNRTLRNLLKLNGFLNIPPHSEAVLTSLSAAQVADIRARPFHETKKGETLVVLRGHEILDLQQMYFEHKSEWKYTSKEFERKKNLLDGGHISELDFELAERNYQQLTASLRGFENKLKLLGIDPEKLSVDNMSSELRIKSPISGSVEQIYTRINDFVNPGDPLIRIINLADMHVELEVFERDLPFIEMGLEVEFWLLDQPTQHQTATIEHISKEVDPQRRTVTVHAHLQKTIEGLRPGNYVEARVILNESPSVALPDDAFVTDQGLTYLFRKTSSDEEHTLFEKILVRVNESDGGYSSFTTVNGESTEGEFVINGAYFLMAQSRINEGRGGDDHH